MKKKYEVTQHYVTFYSPGTFFNETTSKKIDSWDVKKAIKMAKKVTERYDAKPFGFQFSTEARGKKDLNAETIKESPMYYLGGKVETLKQVKARATKDDEILISNMECNGWKKIITNDNSWRIVQPLEKDDIVLDVKL